MSSSFRLQKRKEEKQFYNITPGNKFEDQYIINGAMRQCRPGFQAVKLGSPNGFSICRRIDIENPIIW